MRSPLVFWLALVACVGSSGCTTCAPPSESEPKTEALRSSLLVERAPTLRRDVAPKKPSRLRRGLKLKEVAAAGQRTCGLRPDGWIECWGSRPVDEIPPEGEFHTLVAGGTGTFCALDAENRVRCWGMLHIKEGESPKGQAFVSHLVSDEAWCGLDTAGALTCKLYALRPAKIGHCVMEKPGGAMVCSETRDAPERYGAFTALRGGGGVVCGVLSGGGLECWDVRRMLPQPDSKRDAPRGFPGALRGRFWFVESLRGRYEGGCGLDAAGDLLCWDDDLRIKSVVDAVPKLPEIRDVALGLGHGCVLASDGHIECGGGGDQVGNCGYPDWACGQSPKVEGRFTSVSAGFFHTCALDEEGSVVCWGDDNAGQSSPPQEPSPPTRAALACQPGEDGILRCGDPPKVVALRDVSSDCALLTTGELGCWVPGGPLPYAAPPPNPAYQKVVTGGGILCALDEAGVASCGMHARAGGTPPPPGRLRELAINRNTVCAIDVDSHLACRGGRPEELLLDLVTTTPDGAFSNLDLSDMGFGCALATDGYVRCWGDGGLVDLPRWGPLRQFDIEQLSETACGILPNGDLRCRIDVDWPASSVAVVSEGPYTETAAANHVCALRADGVLNCWSPPEKGGSQTPLMKTREGRFRAVAVWAGWTVAIDREGVGHLWGTLP